MAAPAHSPSTTASYSTPPRRQQAPGHCRRPTPTPSCQQPRVTLYDAYDRQIPYEQAWRWQKDMVSLVCASAAAADNADNANADSGSSSFPSSAPAPPPPLGSLVLLQHPPVYTLGAGASEVHLKFDAAAPPLPLYRTERGGEVTYHGPGQLVMYPILDLRRPPLQPDLHRYLRQLEEVVIRALEACSGLHGERIPGLTGVWVGGQKVAALGVRVRRWVTCHGLALNVVTDLSPFQQIVPCGIAGREVASVAGLLAAVEQQQQHRRRRQGLELPDALADTWEDPLAASLASEAAVLSPAATLADLGEVWTQRAAAEAALLQEYRHALLEAFQEVFEVELEAAEPAGMAALVAPVPAAPQPSPVFTV